MFSCEFCEISKNNFFTEHLWATTSTRITSLTASVLILCVPIGYVCDYLYKSFQEMWLKKFFSFYSLFKFNKIRL